MSGNLYVAILKDSDNSPDPAAILEIELISKIKTRLDLSENTELFPIFFNKQDGIFQFSSHEWKEELDDYVDCVLDVPEHDACDIKN